MMKRDDLPGGRRCGELCLEPLGLQRRAVVTVRFAVVRVDREYVDWTEDGVVVALVPGGVAGEDAPAGEAEVVEVSREAAPISVIVVAERREEAIEWRPLAVCTVIRTDVRAVVLADVVVDLTGAVAIVARRDDGVGIE